MDILFISVTSSTSHPRPIVWTCPSLSRCLHPALGFELQIRNGHPQLDLAPLIGFSRSNFQACNRDGMFGAMWNDRLEAQIEVSNDGNTADIVRPCRFVRATVWKCTIAPLSSSLWWIEESRSERILAEIPSSLLFYFLNQ